MDTGDTILQAIFDHAALGIAQISLDGSLLRVNNRYCEMLGYSQSEMRRRKIWDVTRPADYDEVSIARNQLLEGAISSHSMEKRYIRKDGTAFWGRLNRSLVRDHDNLPRFFIAAVEDITEKREAEQALRDTEQRLRLAVSTGIGMWEHDLRSRIPALSPQYNLAVGRAPLTSEEWFKLVHPDDRERVMALIRESVNGLSEWNAEFRLLYPDGSIHWMLSKGTVLLDDDGRPTRMVGVSIDITERKRNEEALRRSEQRLELAQEVAGIGTWDWDLVTNETHCSSGYGPLYGLPPGDLAPPPEHWINLIYPEERDRIRGGLDRALTHGHRFSEEFRVVWPDGTIHWIYGEGQAFRNTEGKPIRMIGVNVDIDERKRADAALRESEKRFRFLVDVAPVMVWVAGQDKLCTDFNKPWLDFTGRSLQQELGNGWTSGVHPEDLDQCFANYLTSFDARRDFRMEYRLRRADGEYRWILDSGTPFYREGEFAGYVGTCIDVTEQKLIAERTRAEAALRESEERQKFLLTLSDALRPLGEPISIQETATQLVGEYLTLDGCAYGEVDGSGETFTVDRDYTVPGVPSFGGVLRIPDFGKVVMDRCRAGQNTTVADVRTDPLTATPDEIGKYGRVDLRAFVAIPVLKDARLKAVFFGYSRAVRNWTRLESELMADVADRTWSAVERARAEAELRKSEERLRLAAHAARFGTYDMDLVANTVYWSPELRAIIGVPADAPEKGAREVPDFVHPEDRGRVEAMFSRFFDPDGGGMVLDEHRIIRPDGSVRWVQIRGQTRFAGEAESGRPVRHAGVLLDITDRKRDEERLRQSQKLESVGLLAGGIAHDFNNLLTAIMGHASLALDEIPPGPAARIREVIAGAERAAHLTRQLLAYSGKGQFKVLDVDVSRAVQEIADLIQFSIPKSVQLSVNVEKRLPLVRMDPGQLQQILMNLVINAGEAVGEGVPGRVTVGTSMRDVETAFTDARGEQLAAGRYVCIEISDTGEGISEEGRARIFEPFYTTKFTGRGLGLAAVEGILRAQSGGITIESVRGAGSSFRIFLLAAPNSVRTTVQFGETGDFGTVLVVDDERSVRDFIGEALRKSGYRVLLASDGREALAICENGKEKIDAVVLDAIMPLMGAKELLPLIPGLRPNLRVLITSGYSESEARRLCMDYPAADFIGKPYTAHQISKAVEKLLERREGEQNRQPSVK